MASVCFLTTNSCIGEPSFFVVMGWQLKRTSWPWNSRPGQWILKVIDWPNFG